MICPKCKRDLPSDAVVCCYCGKKLNAKKATKRSRRPNGTGNVYPRNNTWTARVVDHYERVIVDGKKKLRPVWKTKGGFKTKRDAINYLPVLSQAPFKEHKPQLFLCDYDLWQSLYETRVSGKTMEGYKAAFQHFATLYQYKVDQISTVDLQHCLDNCGKGKRTKQLMKVIAGLVFKYAIDDNQLAKNPAENLYIGDDETTHYAPLTDKELEKIELSGLPYSDYIVAMCYLGHRPAEFFAFRKSDYHRDGEMHYITGGVKTEAGKHRSVTIPPKILPIIQKRLKVEGTDLLFPRYDLKRDGKLAGTLSQMPVRHFNKFVWHPMMEKLGIVGKVPYATRHTYANKMKAVAGDEKDKAALMGHASYDTTRKHYQTTSLPEAKAITDQIK